MPSIAVSTRSGAPEETAADTRVVGLFEGESLDDPALQQLVDLGEAKPGLKKVAVAHEDAPGGGQRRVLIAGLGKRDELDHEKARVAAAVTAGRAAEVGAVSLSWASPTPEAAGPIVEGTLLALYKFDRFKSSKDDEDDAGPTASSRSRSRVTTSPADEVERARVIADAQNAARDLQNLPGNVATPTFLAERAARDRRRASSSSRWSCSTATRSSASAWAPSRPSPRAPTQEPRLIVLRYSGGDAGAHLGFVGKAVTFDTGGISIKPSSKMQEMKFDMSGGGGRDRGDRRDRGAGAAGHDHRGGPGHREHAERALGEARRHRHRDERQDDRGQQHRRRGPPDPGRRPLLRGRPGRGAHRGPRHADRRDHHRARLDLRRAVRQRRRLVRRGRGRLRRPPASSAGACHSTPSTSS